MKKQIKNGLVLITSLALAAGSVTPVVNVKADNGGGANFNEQAQEYIEVVTMYRLYNPNSGEHFYTANESEKNHLAQIGWHYEGIGWYAPTKDDGIPVYRLYNKNGGEHHYTTSETERTHLVSMGWKSEGVGWYSYEEKNSKTRKDGAVPLYRQYNLNAYANNHNYTTSASENRYLVSLGWRAEGIGWYGVSTDKADIAEEDDPDDGLYYTETNSVQHEWTNSYLDDIESTDHALILTGKVGYSLDEDDFDAGNGWYSFERYVFTTNASTKYAFVGGDDPTKYVSKTEFVRRAKEFLSESNPMGLDLHVKNGVVIDAAISS